MGITVLKGAGSLVIPGVSIHDQDARQRFQPQDGLGDLGRSRLSELEKAEGWGGEQPNIAVFLLVRQPVSSACLTSDCRKRTVTVAS